MQAPGDGFEALMAELRQEFLDRMSSDRPALDQARQDAKPPETRAKALETLAFTAHRLAGLGRTFGYQVITDRGMALEAAVEAVGKGSDGADAEREAHLEGAIDDLCEAIDGILSEQS